MARHRSSDPFTAWTRLAFRTGEMMLSAAEVIAHRTTRAALSGIAPRADDSTEFTRMGTEKAEAAMECASVAARHALQAGWRQAALAWQDAWRIGSDVTLLAASATPAHALHHQARIMQRFATGNAARDGASSLLALSNALLTPVHRRAAANAKRLRRARR